MRTASKAKKQSKLMRFISTPIRTLTKAKNFYMRNLEDCAGKVGYGGAGVSGYTASNVHLPRSFSVNSSNSNGDKDLKQLRRLTVSTKKNNDVKKDGNREAGGSDTQRRPIVRERPIVKQRTMNSGMGMRSYSVGLKMGRIDEEIASTFEEDDEVDVKADLYSRSRSYAVKNRNAGFV
ncbi:uncharacterized protein LOC133736360 [Rosa rugosa]|uniref:uncharacterized protein LOC133736360 n=1 Tax=Rosa rugosa TaxID=74645 RepID=UPI002B409B6B|nr:uncharacterized protein LOC133736360 [Rosa rugosa]